MPRFDRHQVFDGRGNLVSDEVVKISDAEIELEQDAEHLKALVNLARTPADEWTNQDLRTAARLLLRSALHKELRATVARR